MKSRIWLRVLALAFLVGLPALAEDQIDLQKPPASIPQDFPTLPPLLKSSAGKPITSASQWKKQRTLLREQWVQLFGGLPAKKAALKSEFLEKQELSGFTRQYVRYQIEDGVFTDGYLLTPKGMKGKLPAIVVFHPTTPFQARGVAGLEAEYAEEKLQGIQLVQRGYVVWCPRNYIFDDVPGATSIKLYTANAKKVIAKHPAWTGMTRMVWDAICAADFVESLPNVDKKRIGCIGHSLGGKQAFYAAAFDERYKAAVSSEGGIGLKFSNWDAVWYLGERIQQKDFALENHQVLALVAPRAFLLLAGNSADNDKSWAFIKAAMPVYDLYGKSSNLGWFNHAQGHRYPPEARAVAEKFFADHLK